MSPKHDHVERSSTVGTVHAPEESMTITSPIPSPSPLSSHACMYELCTYKVCVKRSIVTMLYTENGNPVVLLWVKRGSTIVSGPRPSSGETTADPLWWESERDARRPGSARMTAIKVIESDHHMNASGTAKSMWTLASSFLRSPRAVAFCKSRSAKTHQVLELHACARLHEALSRSRLLRLSAHAVNAHSAPESMMFFTETTNAKLDETEVKDEEPSFRRFLLILEEKLGTVDHINLNF